MSAPQDERLIADHYELDGLEARVLTALERQHGDLDRLAPADLNAVDEFHLRGRASTEELLERLGPLRDAEVLDVGSGLGGTARYLAERCGCHVTGIDLTPAYVSLATRLSGLVGLSETTDFRCASATELPFPEASFDVAWMAHVQMNIADKRRLAAELFRVLRPGGRLALHEIFQGTGGAPHYPVPWAADASASFLVTAAAFREALEAKGMRVREWTDVSAPTRDWADKAAARLGDAGPPPLGVHLLMGDTAGDKLRNIARNLAEDRVQVVQAVLERA